MSVESRREAAAAQPLKVAIMGLLASLDDRAYKGDLLGVQRLLANGKDVNKPAATAGKVSNQNESVYRKCDGMVHPTEPLASAEAPLRSSCCRSYGPWGDCGSLGGRRGVSERAG